MSPKDYLLISRRESYLLLCFEDPLSRIKLGVQKRKRKGMKRIYAMEDTWLGGWEMRESIKTKEGAGFGVCKQGRSQVPLMTSAS